MKKILIIFILFIAIFIISCNKADKNDITNNTDTDKNDITNNTDNNEPNSNLSGDNNSEIINQDIKVINDFIVSNEINLFIDEEIEIDIQYDNDIEVEFNYTIDNDNIIINDNKIKAVKPGISIITIKELRSNITKNITVNVLIKKNKAIDFYNGYYVYKKCVFKESSGQNIYQVDDMYSNNLYIELNDNLDLVETDSILEFDEMYDIYENGIFQEKSILIKDNKLYVALMFKGHCADYLSLREYYAYLIYDTDYSFDKPNEIKSDINKDLNINNGTYVYGGIIYRSDPYKELALSNNLGSFALEISENFEYKKYDESILDDIERNSLETEISKVKEEVDSKYGFTSFDSETIYNIIYDNQVLSNKLIVLNGNLYLMYLVKHVKTGKVMIHTVERLTYVPVNEQVINDDNYIDCGDLVGKYKYTRLLSGDVKIDLIGSIALEIKQNMLLKECDNNLFDLKEYISKESKVYEIIDNDSYIKNYIIFSNNSIYYVKAYKQSRVFRKDSAKIIMTEIWEIEKCNDECKEEINESLNVLCGLYYGYECVLTNISSNTIDSWNEGKVQEELLEITSATSLEGKNINDLLTKYTLEQSLHYDTVSRHMKNICLNETIYKVKTIGDTRAQYLVSDTKGNFYLMTTLSDNDYVVISNIIKLKRVEEIKNDAN